MHAVALTLLLAIVGLATLSKQYATALQVVPGLQFPFYSVTPFSINATSYETETLVATPDATSM